MELNTTLAPYQPVTQKDNPLLKVRQLSKTFVLGKSIVRQMLGRRPDILRAVHNVDLDIYPGECLGLVGESGCGKTTLGRCILRLYEPDSGEVMIEGQDFLGMNGSELSKMRSKIQIVFQDPYSSLNPRLTAGKVLSEASLVHGICTPQEAPQRVEYLLNMVGLSADVADRYPHELSGGQRQRVGLARALAVEPKFIVADEPVSALDVSIQAQVINLLVELQEKLHLTMLFITHDLRLVRYVSHRVAVMYLGSVVEMAPTNRLFKNPRHPYTQALLAAAPLIDPRRRATAPAIKGEPPNPINIGVGCPFRPRCDLAFDRCAQEDPLLQEIEPGHFVSCFAVHG
jgi:oligopeptide transport system ATP-binding protein